MNLNVGIMKSVTTTINFYFQVVFHAFMIHIDFYVTLSDGIKFVTTITFGAVET